MMANKPSDYNPIFSQAERDLIFTDPQYELSGSFSGKGGTGQRALKKKPWFAQKMNLQGRLFQFVITLTIAFIGFGVGLRFLQIPYNFQSISLLIEYGYRGPYHGIQIINSRMLPSLSSTPNDHFIEITLFNFEDAFLKPGSIVLSFTQEKHPKVIHHKIECCEEPLSPQKPFHFTEKIPSAHLFVGSIEAKIINQN